MKTQFLARDYSMKAVSLFLVPRSMYQGTALPNSQSIRITWLEDRFWPLAAVQPGRMTAFRPKAAIELESA